MNNDVAHFRLKQMNESRTLIKTILFIAFCESAEIANDEKIDK